jgi:hypothetical protein
MQDPWQWGQTVTETTFSAFEIHRRMLIVLLFLIVPDQGQATCMWLRSCAAHETSMARPWPNGKYQMSRTKRC